MNPHYPIHVKMEGMLCAVIGGGEVAQRKVGTLLECGAIITIISPEITPLLAEWTEQGKINWKRELYQGQDLSPYFFIVAATNHRHVNYSVYEQAKRTKAFINIADRPDLCNYIVPSTVKRGRLVISVSTSGASPSLASKLRRRLEREFGQEYEGYVDFLAQMRLKVLQEIKDATVRKQIFQELLDDRYVEAPSLQREQMADALLQQVKQREQL